MQLSESHSSIIPQNIQLPAAHLILFLEIYSYMKLISVSLLEIYSCLKLTLVSFLEIYSYINLISAGLFEIKSRSGLVTVLLPSKMYSCGGVSAPPK